MSNILNATNPQIEAAMAKMSPEDRAVIQKALKGSKSKRMDEAKVLAKGSHVIPGTLAYDETAKKQYVYIACQFPGCSEERKTFTSDVHQVKMCDAHRAEQRKANKAAEQARVKAILEKAGL